MLDENREARACYERAEPIYREIGDRLGEANCRRSIALLDQKQNLHGPAMEKFAQALSIAEAIGDRFTQAFVNLEWADSLVALKQISEAKQRLQNAIDLFEAIGRPDRAQQCREKLARL
jgi:tetratricopeptide (TPR) repeat protein